MICLPDYGKSPTAGFSMPSDDHSSHATSDIDFYTLLGVTFETSQKDIDRAWRRTALKYHPDHRGNDPVAKEKFHLAQIGYDLLSDPSSKAIYDNARTARLQRKRQNELFEGRRRQMKDDLEARERGVKRSRDEEVGEEEKLEREVRRLAEDGKRRRKEREEALRKDIQQTATLSEQTVESPGPNRMNDVGSKFAGSGVAEIDRTVKVRWSVEGDGGLLTTESVKKLFVKFGVIESADLLAPKKLRLGKKQKKQMVVVCMIQYASVVGAHAAVEDFARQKGPEWEIYDSVFWAANKEPEFLKRSQRNEEIATSAPSTPMPGPKNATPHLISGTFSTPISTACSRESNMQSTKEKPSFSFSPKALGTPKSSPLAKGSEANSPSSEELMMIRLKNAEKKRQELERLQTLVEIQRQDEANDAASNAKCMV